MRSQSLSDVLFTKTQQKVLGLLFIRPDESFYMNEIVRLAGVGKGTIKRELDRMQAAGLLTVKPIGNQIHYQANKRSPIYEELLSIVRKTFGIVEVIKASLQQLDAQIDLAFIYGSVAKHEDTAGSDVDLMVVTGSLAYAELMEALARAEETIGRPINPTIYDVEQLKGKLHDQKAFVEKVMEQPKLWVKGSDDDIRSIRESGKNKKAKGRTT